MAKKTRKQTVRDEQIYRITSTVAGNFTLQEVLDKLVESAVRIVGVKACSIRLLDEQTGDLRMSAAFGLSEEYRNRAVVSRQDTVISAAFSGEVIVIDNMASDARVKYKDAAVKEGLVSQLTVGIHFRDKAIGVLRLYSPRPKRFDEDDIAIARLVANQCAVAITNARLYAEALEGARISEQMRLAGIIQRRMIPETAPVLDGLDIAAAYRPCFDIGGDLYDFVKMDEQRVLISIADVMGKGMPAAIVMSLFKGTIRAYTDSEYRCPTMADIIRQLNRAACRQFKDSEFITLFAAEIDVKKAELTYCNCGHEPVILIRGGKAINLEKGGLVLGFTEEAEHTIETVKLKDGDCLLFYTDGLIDAVNFEGRLWGRKRMIQTAKKFAGGTAEQMVKNLLLYRRRFIGLAAQVDDTSIVVVKFDRTSKPVPAKKMKL